MCHHLFYCLLNKWMRFVNLEYAVGDGSLSIYLTFFLLTFYRWLSWQVFC